MSKEETPKAYRGFSEDKSSYFIDGKNFTFVSPSANTMQKLRDRLLKIDENFRKNPRGNEFYKLQNESLELSCDIIKAGLKDVNIEELRNSCHQSELEGMAGDVFGFLAIIRSPRERELLTKQLEEIQKLSKNIQT